MAKPLHTKGQLAAILPVHLDRTSARTQGRIVPKPRRFAPEFTRAALRNLRKLSGLVNVATVLQAWRVALSIDRGSPFTPATVPPARRGTVQPPFRSMPQDSGCKNRRKEK